MTLLASTMESVDGVRVVLDKWKGFSALLHSYAASLRILDIAVTETGYNKGIMIECLEVRQLTAPTGWSASEFLLLPTSERGVIQLYKLQDINAGAEIVCGDIAIEPFEDVKGRPREVRSHE